MWYIDSIDPRGGLAFVSRRNSDLANDPPALEPGITAFLAPPGFQPEFLESRGPGFALGRSHGQIGLFLKGKEAPFDSLDAASEFVRRVYVRGSTGDTPLEGGGEGLVPRPPREGPSPEGVQDEPLEPLPPTGGDPLRLITVFVDTLTQKSAKLDIGQSLTPAPLFVADKSQLDAEASAKRLVRAAITLLTEAQSRSLASLQAEQLSVRLREVCARMGLWPLVYNRQLIPDLGKWLTQSRLSCECLDGYGQEWSRHAGYLQLRSSSDPFEDLALIPVPPVHSHTGETFQTLQSVLGLICSTPGDLLEANAGSNERLIELALFAASYLTLGREEAPLGLGNNSASLERDFLSERLKASLAWLSLNLPRHVFADPLEETIWQASGIDRASGAHLTSTPPTGKTTSATSQPPSRTGAAETELGYRQRLERRNYRERQQGEEGLMASQG